VSADMSHTTSFTDMPWNRVISFSEENGFEKLSFPTHEEKFKFAIDRGNEGFGIQ